jgi:phage gp36-like protein
MAYATESSLDMQYGTAAVTVAADRDGDGTRDTGVIDAAISDAEDEIDSYLGVVYSLPLTSTPDILSRVCGDIALYRMCSDAGTLTDEMRRRYDDAIAWLSKVASGKATLGVDAADEDIGDVAEVTSGSQSRLFTRSTLGGLL